MLNKLNAFVITLSLLCGAAAAGPFEDSVAAYQKGDYATALRIIRPLAEQGDPHAQNNLGAMYDTGQGVRRSYPEAMKWYRRAAEQGDARAQGNLGAMYSFGRGVKEDKVEAARWYRLAAEQGLAEAQFNLGSMLRDGSGVQQDYGEALKWYRLGADQGHSDSQVGVGAIYMQGLAGAKDPTEAAKWFALAADQGNASAQVNIAGMYARGEGVQQDDVQAHKWSSLVASQPRGAPFRDPAIRLRDELAAKMTAEQRSESTRLAAAQVAAQQAYAVPPEVLAQSYLAVAYNRVAVDLAKLGVRVTLALDGKAETVTQRNAEAYISSFEARLSGYGQAIQKRGFQQVGGAYVMKASPDCRQLGFGDRTVTISQSDFKLSLESGFPAESTGVIIGETIAIEHALAPEVHLLGTVAAGSIELHAATCTLTLMPAPAP